MRKALLAAVICLATGAFAQTTTVTHGTGVSCAINYTFATVYCVALKNNDGTAWMFWFHYIPDGTFSNGNVALTDSHGGVIFTASNFSGTWNGIVQGTFSGVTAQTPSRIVSGTDFEQVVTVCSCYRSRCHCTPQVQSGNVTYTLQ